MNLFFSFIIPVYNRPQEIDELLASLTKQHDTKSFEVLVVEDGSTNKCETIVHKYSADLELRYFYKENTGAGASRNFGMQQAKGNYFIILDSDVIVPKQYVLEVKNRLKTNYTDAFGGPDAAHHKFTPLQKAINYSMTSVFTTGGIRGKKKGVGKFQPRSFNLGLSKKAFEITGGFSTMKNGEDIDLTFRLWQQGFETQLIETAFVYHKRRSSILQFFNQTFGFGTARPILNKKYPNTAKITYWFPTLFILGLDISIIAAFFGIPQGLFLYGIYFIIVFVDSLILNKNLAVSMLSVLTTCTQFLGYGLGFLESKLINKSRE